MATDELSMYKEKYDWIKSNLDKSLKGGLLMIATELSSMIHLSNQITKEDMLGSLCAIRNAIWEVSSTEESTEVQNRLPESFTCIAREEAPELGPNMYKEHHFIISNIEV